MGFRVLLLILPRFFGVLNSPRLYFFASLFLYLPGSYSRHLLSGLLFVTCCYYVLLFLLLCYLVALCGCLWLIVVALVPLSGLILFLVVYVMGFLLLHYELGC